jgi:hypothetical protein
MSSSSNTPAGASYDATVAHLRQVLGSFAPGYGEALPKPLDCLTT